MRIGIKAVVLFASCLYPFASTSAGGEHKAPEKPDEPEKPHLTWMEDKTDRILFTSRDIVRFDWDQQVFQLTRDKAIDLLSLPPALQRDFVVRDGEGIIYRGCFMNSGSSFGYDGPTIRDGLVGKVKPPLYHVAGGYPRGGGSRDATRFDPRIEKGLQSANVLGQIDENDNVLPIEQVFCGWHGQEHGRKVAMTLFPETFRIGRDARFTLRFATARPPGLTPQELEKRARLGKDKTAELELDTLEAHITLTANGGKFVCSKQVNIPPDILRQKPFGVFSFRGPLWDASADRTRLRVQPGPGELAVSVIASKKRGTGTDTEQIGSWTIPPQKVQILPAKKKPTTLVADEPENAKEKLK